EEPNPPERPRWDVMGRLKSGISLSAAQAEVDSIEKGLREAQPQLHPNSVRVVPLREHFTGDVRKPLLVLFLAVAFLLFIACANVANLMLARATERENELTIRSALGAAQTRLFRQLATEGFAFSLIAGTLGALGAMVLVPVLKALAPAGTPLLADVTLNTRSLLFAFLLSFSIGILLGSVPAWHAAKRNLGESLARYSTTGHRTQRLSSFLVAAEFALAMLLLTGAGLLIRSFIAVLRVDVGFRAANVLTVEVNLPDTSAPPRIAQFYRDVMERLAALPGVQAVGGVSNLFFLDETRTHALRLVEGRPPEPKSAWKPRVWAQVSGDYFQAMGIPLLRGRFFNENDNPDSPPVVIVNETLAKRYWPGEDPVGKHLKGFDPRGKNDDWLTVVGVVKDTRSGGLEKAPFSQIYEVQSQRGEQIGNLVIRTSAETSRTSFEVRGLIRHIDSAAVVSSINTVEQLLSEQEMQRRFQTWLVTVFSGLALALAALGVFAVMRHSVAARTNEIGIRMALGAETGDIARLVLSNATRLAAIGIAAGAVAGIESTRAIATMLYRVKPTDILSFTAAAGTLLAISLLASYVPARHASRIDPMSALRRN
ncbi:MAG: FtsX-like permease family protein, partial [Acidobacteriaceae bacterium]|nr:FtsX-like permease family protein [Acidobacteriaceae bacterium]